MLVYGNIKSTAKRTRKKSINTLKDKVNSRKVSYKPSPIFAPRGNNTLTFENLK